MYNRKEIKELVKEQIKGNYWLIIGLLLTQSAVTSVTSGLSWLFIGALTLGSSVFFLNIAQNKERSLGDLFSGFNVFFKALGLFLLTGLITAAGMMLFIVPGVLASLYLSQVYYILAEENSKSITQCISESYEMMKGNCFKLWILNLSYTWFFAVVLIITAPLMLMIPISLYVSAEAMAVMLLLTVSLLLGTSVIFVMAIAPRYHLALANFYLCVSGNQGNIRNTEYYPTDNQYYPRDNRWLE